MRTDGVLFHAKHAFMPNSLGYCGPDEDGTIREHLEDGTPGEGLVSALQGFEAAYPFLKLIARNAGTEVFDYSVPEAYWIGNGLLDKVRPEDFLGFAREELKGTGMKSLSGSFRDFGEATPHHTLYVMGTYVGKGGDGPRLGEDPRRKVEALVDNCRISWGEVKAVGKRELTVVSRPLSIGEGGFVLSAPHAKEVSFNPLVRPFGRVKPGDVVSVHWNYACEVLTRRQAANIERYTLKDIRSVNALLRKRRP